MKRSNEAFGGANMMDDDLRAIIDQARRTGASYAEARYQKDSYESIFLKNGIPEVASFEVKKGIGIRVMVDGAFAFGGTNDLGKASLKKVVDRTVRSAKASSASLKRRSVLGEAELGKGSVIVPARIDFDMISLESRLDLLKEADGRAMESAKKAEVKLAGRYSSLDTLITEKQFISSDGSNVSSIVPRAVIDVMLSVHHPQKGSIQRVFSIGESSGWEAVERWDLPERLATEVSTMGGILAHGVSMKQERCDVILGPEVTGIVSHESAGHPGEADRILGRESAQAGEAYLDSASIGKKIGSEVVNVVDDPTLPRSFGYYLNDDEGVKARRRYLIKEGKVHEFLHNRETAGALGTNSNASSRSVAFDREPIVRMANTFVEPSDNSFEELLEGVKQGVYIKNFMEWNIDDRRYNQRYVGLEAYRVSDGRLGERIRNPVLEITTPALWSSVDAVGKDLQFQAAYCGKGDPMQGIPVWTGGPHVRLRDIKLGGAQ